MNGELTFSFLNMLGFIHSTQLLVPVELHEGC